MRQTIPFVKYTDAQGSVHEYAAEGTTPEQLAKGTWRTMDCVDCHNVVAHRVAPTPEQAVDTALAAGRIDRGLPFVRREGVRLMKSTYQTGDEAARVIDADLRKFYTSRGRAVDAQVTGAVTALQDDLPPKRVSGDEGHLRHLSRQPRPHDVVRVFSLPRRQPAGQGRQFDQLGLRGTATSSWTLADPKNPGTLSRPADAATAVVSCEPS